MFEATRANKQLLAGAILLNLVLALVVGAGIMVRPLNMGMVLAEAPASSAAVLETGTLAVLLGGVGLAVPAAGTTTPEGPASSRRSLAAGLSTTKAPPPTPVAANLAAAATLAAAPVESPPARGPAPRVEPSKAAMQAAIRELDARTNFFRPTETQIRDVGNQVCTAFDQGHVYSQVKAAVLEAAKQAPYLGVSAADADYAVRSAVAMFCPGHQPSLA